MNGTLKMLSRSILLPSMMLLALSCRISKVGKDLPTESNKQGNEEGATATKPIVQPQQQQGAFSETQPVTLDDDGKFVEKISLRLDYFATPKPGGVTMPSCYDAIAGQLVIGKLVCGSATEVTMDVQANQLDQVCHTDNATPSVPAKSALIFAGCKGPATFQVYKFEPSIKVDIQKQ